MGSWANIIQELLSYIPHFFRTSIYVLIFGQRWGRSCRMGSFSFCLSVLSSVRPVSQPASQPSPRVLRWEDGKSSCSRKLRPASGTLPRYSPTTTARQHKAGQGYSSKKCNYSDNRFGVQALLRGWLRSVGLEGPTWVRSKETTKLRADGTSG